ncbi:hypothetical protein SAMN05216188_121125 [Lentzea xinjiangensis]|uniref:Uncharacterized protein n=1 Tax=Lentzea xinjiangensis TaxID=402600 RepID=A0A1H9UHW3_9PSEU|nr:hypothetical protein [Lentzea xinjiangensis]SES08939.1 hypothetical protein SAMN05216188_121125 [Lentzea xinjiangensis]
MDFDKPVPDALDQQRFARPQDAAEDEELEHLTIGEADPADVVDQHRVAPVEREPWP